MDDLIKRQDAINAIWDIEDDPEVLSIIKSLPSAQKKGKWFIEPNKGTITCSTCKEEISYYPAIGINPIWNYCPYCGAYMRGEEE